MNLNESATQKVARTCYSDIGYFLLLIKGKVTSGTTISFIYTFCISRDFTFKIGEVTEVYFFLFDGRC